VKVRVIALGSPHGGDDELALRLAEQLRGDDIEVIAAGRPGPGLVDLLDTRRPILLLDVVRSAAAPGTIYRVELGRLPEAAAAREPLSSHGFGPAEALKLARALGRALPPGEFVGIEGASFEVGAPVSPALREAFGAFAAAAREALARLCSREVEHA
jgi:hydrogenase maturation protease